MIGTTISHYTILEKLGEGGMGVVYKAQDLTLDRLVALKFLPESSSAGTDSSRFLQEAKAAAALNHPNICTIHGIEEAEGRAFIVMEFVEGQTLQEKKPSLSMKQAIEIGIQIADGLAAAHEKGIIHRDIKPENIMIRKDGIVQIMDFGLAKLRGASRLTKEGSTVGTVGYMSPEQVQGLETDHRSDIFSLGVILYEMLAGQAPFKGIHETAISYEIVNVDPDPIAAVKPNFDPQLDTIILDCLEKDLKERRQSAAEVSRDLRRVKRESSRSRVSRVSSARPLYASSGQAATNSDQMPKNRISRRELVAWSLGGLFLIAAGALGMLILREPEARVVRASLLPPTAFTFSHENGGHIAVSPDGRMVAFVSLDSLRRRTLWVRPMNALTGQQLSGTEGAQYPFWSADSRFIGFFAGQKLKKIEASGGPPQTICDAISARGGAWNHDGIIIFASQSNGPLQRVSSSGGTPTPVTTLDSTRGDLSHRWPWFLPDGQHFLYTTQTTQTGGADADMICVGSLDGSETSMLMHASSNSAFAAGHLLFMREQSLMAQPFDVKGRAFTGDAFPIAEQVLYWADRNKANFSVSENGVLAYQTGTSFGSSQLTWYDRSGKELERVGSPGTIGDFKISPDGKQIVFSQLDIRTRNEDLWIYDLTRKVQTRFTFDPSSDRSPVWSPDGSRIIFASRRKQRFDLYQRASSGAGNEELVLESGRSKYPTAWSADGRFLLHYTDGDPKTILDVWVLPLATPAHLTDAIQSSGEPVSFLKTEFIELFPAISPDGKWVAYTSFESGTAQVYVRPFPGPGGKYQVSTLGGGRPLWRRDGKELFYVGTDNKLMVAEVSSTGQSFVIGAVRPLFEIHPPQGISSWFDVTADGKRFLVNSSTIQDVSSPVTLVVNWDAELKKK